MSLFLVPTNRLPRSVNGPCLLCVLSYKPWLSLLVILYAADTHSGRPLCTTSRTDRALQHQLTKNTHKRELAPLTHTHTHRRSDAREYGSNQPLHSGKKHKGEPLDKPPHTHAQTHTHTHTHAHTE